jgi:hypothetical protein
MCNETCFGIVQAMAWLGAFAGSLLVVWLALKIIFYCPENAISTAMWLAFCIAWDLGYIPQTDHDTS